MSRAAVQGWTIGDIAFTGATQSSFTEPVHILLGQALDASNRTEEATAEFEAAVKAANVPPEAHFGVGYLYWKQKLYEDACRECEAELASQPQHAQALTYLGDAEMHTQRDQVAETHLRRALDLDANARLAHLDLGIVLAARSSLGRQEEAEVEFEKVKMVATEKASPLLELHGRRLP